MIGDFKKLVLGMVFLLILFVGFSFNQEKNNFQQIKVSAGEGHNMSGYAWSDNIGWISFNCLDEDTCGTVNYGVNIESNNDLSGYAWSDNIGWISFNESDLVSCPKGACKAKILNNITLEGWAKALSANGNGWDGWISLSKQPSGTVNYGVNLNGTEFTGYAWGSNVIGWIDFSPTGYPGVLLGAFPVIEQFNVGSVLNGGSPTISWTTVNSEKCEGSWISGDLCSTVETCASGTSSGGAVTSETSYTLTCYGASGEVSETKTPSAYYNLEFVNGYPNNVDVEFVASGATTTATKIGVAAWNGFNEDISINAQLNLTTPEALSAGSYAIYSNQILSPSNYATGSDISIFIKSPVTGVHTVPITGSGDILGGLNLIINAQGTNPLFQEI